MSTKSFTGKHKAIEVTILIEQLYNWGVRLTKKLVEEVLKLMKLIQIKNDVGRAQYFSMKLCSKHSIWLELFWKIIWWHFSSLYLFSKLQLRNVNASKFCCSIDFLDQTYTWCFKIFNFPNTWFSSVMKNKSRRH